MNSDSARIFSSFSDFSQRLHKNISVPVFYSAALVIITFVFFGTIMPERLGEAFNHIQVWILETFGWFYLLSVSIFLVLTILLASSSAGDIRLGAYDSKPRFGYFSWFAMLFSAGTGIGLMFFSVAEPIMHFSDPPTGEAGTNEAAREAMRITFFHWGIHAWAIYAVVGMSLAYFGYRYNLPLTVRSALYPLIGERIYGPIGHIVDIFAIFGTMFGVATSLGLGVMQVNAGLNYLFGMPVSTLMQSLLIACITAIATMSVVLGLDAGIRRLSYINLVLAIILVVFVIVLGPTLYLLQVWLENLGTYVSSLVDMTFKMRAYTTDESAREWLGDWTLFYWAWWISWSPFVGMFIARISHGRTIREFVCGVLLVPVLFSSIWLTAFGNSAIQLDMAGALGELSASVSASMNTAIFKFLEYLPLTSITSIVAIVLVIIFFVTSSDSGSLVIDIIASGGQDDPPVWQRVFWAISEGVVAIILLLAGGLSALQTAAITAGLPFTFIMLFVCYGLFKGLMLEKNRVVAIDTPGMRQIDGASIPWKDRLDAVIARPDRDEVRKFLKKTVKPALQDIAQELEDNQGLKASVKEEENYVRLTIQHDETQDFTYGIHIREYKEPAFQASRKKEKGKNNERMHQSYCHAEVHLNEGDQFYNVHGLTQEQIISDVLSQYERHIHFLHVAR